MDSNEPTLDLMTCLRAVQVDAATGIALVTSIVAAAPPAPGPAMARALDALTASGDALERGYRVRTHAAAPVDLRPFDVALDRAWSAMVQRLQSWQLLPAEAHPEVARATAVLDVIAVDGLVVLKLPYRAQWAALTSRMKELHERGLDADLTALAGASFVWEVRARLDDYGVALGVTKPQAAEPDEVNLSELLRAVQQRVTEYVVQVFATVVPGDAATTKAAREALRPLLTARDAALSARKVPGAEKEEAPKPADDAPKPADDVAAKPAAPAARPSKPAPRPSAPPPA